jgi:hypothetical protein
LARGLGWAALAALFLSGCGGVSSAQQRDGPLPDRFVDSSGGVSVRYPADWRVRTMGRIPAASFSPVRSRLARCTRSRPASTGVYSSPVVTSSAGRSGKWQAARCASTSKGHMTGSTSAQIACARGQRVRKRQPDGGSAADGSSPFRPSFVSWLESVGSGTGIASSNAAV